MICPKCSSQERVKNGFLKGIQRYLCKGCNYTYSKPFRGKSKEVKRKAIDLYLEGLGFRAVGRHLGVSNVAVLKWVRTAAEILRAQLVHEMPTQKKAIKVMEFDEMWHFALKKSQKRGSGWLSIEKLVP